MVWVRFSCFIFFSIFYFHCASIVDCSISHNFTFWRENMEEDKPVEYDWSKLHKGPRLRYITLKLNKSQFWDLWLQHDAACNGQEGCSLPGIHYYFSKLGYQADTGGWQGGRRRGKPKRAFKDSDPSEVRAKKVAVQACGRASPPGPCWCGQHKDKKGNPMLMKPTPSRAWVWPPAGTGTGGGEQARQTAAAVEAVQAEAGTGDKKYQPERDECSHEKCAAVGYCLEYHPIL